MAGYGGDDLIEARRLRETGADGQSFDRPGGPSIYGVNVGKLNALLESASGDRHYARLDPKAQHRKNKRELPLMDCFTAPCIDTCPIHQDITAYMDLVADKKYVEALQIILEKNPLPFITGPSVIIPV